MKSQETWWTDLLFIAKHCQNATLVVLVVGAMAGLFGGYFIGSM